MKPDGSLLNLDAAAIAPHVAQRRARRAELERLLADPGVLSDSRQAQRLNREYRDVVALVRAFDELEQTGRAIADTRSLEQSDEPEIAELARAELEQLERRRNELQHAVLRQLLPRDPDWDKDCILEIRAAAGGEESALFAADLQRMYARYVERLGWRFEVLDSRPSDLDGFREIITAVEGDGPYRLLRFESGVHRVQRVPRTEASGRIHTSTVTVAVLPEFEESEVRLDPSELKIEVFRAGGHGGQLVNKIESAVRITHLPTGLRPATRPRR